jgi:hypothetical protein
MFLRESSEKRAIRVARTTQKSEKRGEHHARPYQRESYRVNLTKAIEEWAADYEGTHSVFED